MTMNLTLTLILTLILILTPTPTLTLTMTLTLTLDPGQDAELRCEEREHETDALKAKCTELKAQIAAQQSTKNDKENNSASLDKLTEATHNTMRVVD